ncbi:tetrapyrrole-binding protein, chloroplastic-like [Salvia splendens]|uniref:tetrapyrrole-binding protein, chloroplastic-like n=1 Tax=Salvia splendens TaxID=180675 RepID=UPI001C27BF23|nr:tetrapyrrole-binding protein, chloroplastic-like [Salvia splendens]
MKIRKYRISLVGETKILHHRPRRDAAVKRGYVFFSEVQFIPAEALREINALWRQPSDGKFIYSVQQRIWKKLNGDFTAFFIKVGWMKKLESSDVEQYNYRSFPVEFVWEMEEGPPEGHLLLTNVLRGPQLLNCILSHPAFDGEDDALTGKYRRNN